MYNRREEILNQAFKMGIRIKVAYKQSNKSAIAIHLLEPDMDEIENSLERAHKEGFDTIMIHTKMTWPTA